MKSKKIKFRAFIDGEMIDADALAFEEYLPVSQLLSNCDNIMQFTGLHDKNSKEIYEGDIVRFPELYETPEMTSTYYVLAEVVFEYGAFHIKCKGQEISADTYNLAHEMKNYDDNFEISGNIHQHPDLLK